MSKVISSEGKQVNPRTILKEKTLAKATSKEKMELIRYYKKTTCDICGTTSFYMPQYQKVICPSCMKIPTNFEGNLDDILPYDFLTQEAKDKLRSIATGKSKYRVVYPSPDYFPEKDLPGRNEKCVCGSGKKYKKCCMARIREAKEKTIEDTVTRNKNATIVAIANTAKLVNSISRYFSSNPDKDSVPMEDIESTPFANIEGELETPAEPDPDIKEAVPVEDAEVVEESGQEESGGAGQ